jgi:hypothetical protein
MLRLDLPASHTNTSLVAFIPADEDSPMQDPKDLTDNPNVLLEGEIEEFGLEEADDSLGPSWDEVEKALLEREKNNGGKD